MKLVTSLQWKLMLRNIINEYLYLKRFPALTSVASYPQSKTEKMNIARQRYYKMYVLSITFLVNTSSIFALKICGEENAKTEQISAIFKYRVARSTSCANLYSFAFSVDSKQKQWSTQD